MSRRGIGSIADAIERLPAPPADLPRLPRRAADSHKGTFGTVCVLGGCAGDLLDSSGGKGPTMIGAPALSALAALRAGAGLVRIAAPGPVLPHALSLCPGATGVAIPTDNDGWYEPSQAAAVVDRVGAMSDVLTVGPGLGTSPGACALVLRSLQQDRLPVVLDADGLNCLSSIPEFFRDFHASAVLTPHPGEFRRLVASLGLKGDLGLASSREKAAEQLAQRVGRIVVLKGHESVVSDGQRTWVNKSTWHLGEGGVACLATAGTGDVLTGLIGALVGQFAREGAQESVSSLPPGIDPKLRQQFAMLANAARPRAHLDLFAAACVGVYLHARAGCLWMLSRGCDGGMLATELADLLPYAVQSLRE